MTFPSVNGRAYWLQSSTDLVTWITAQSNIVGTGANQTVTVVNGVPDTHVFYRIGTSSP